MSKIAIEGNVSGIGTLTIAAPNTNTNRTITLPDATGTLALTGAASDKIEEGNSKVEVVDTGTGHILFQVDGSEVARFNPDQLVTKAGTASTPAVSPTGDLNTGMFFPAANISAIACDGIERVRVTASGYFKASNTGTFVQPTGASHELISNLANNDVVFIRNTAASVPFGIALDFTGASPNDTSRYFLRCADSTAQRATIRSNGGLANFSANNVNLSDRREKVDFAPAKNYLNTICAIPVQTFNYIDQNHEEDPGLTLGVVAQDVQEVAPEFVMESNWGTKEEPKMRLSIYQTDLQYALMKCIQELKVELDQAKTRIAALENNNA